MPRRVFRKTIFTALAALAALGPNGRAGETVPIALHDGLVWANVNCGGSKLHFVVDTGAASSCLNLATAKRLGVRLGSALYVAGVDGSTTGYRCEGFQANAGGMSLPCEVVALDLSGPGRRCSEAIDGLIGADFFRGKVMRIDYARAELTREDWLAGRGGTPLRFEDGVICVPVGVNGGAARWTRLDTGCAEALLWCGGAGRGVKGPGKTVALASLGKSPLRAEVTVGRTEMQGVPVQMREREIFPGEAGLLGNGALLSYRVTIDGIGKRLVLEREL